MSRPTLVIVYLPLSAASVATHIAPWVNAAGLSRALRTSMVDADVVLLSLDGLVDPEGLDLHPKQETAPEMSSMRRRLASTWIRNRWKDRRRAIHVRHRQAALLGELAILIRDRTHVVLIERHTIDTALAPLLDTTHWMTTIRWVHSIQVVESSRWGTRRTLSARDGHQREGRSLESADHCVAVTQQVVDDARSIGVDTANFRVIGNGTDLVGRPIPIEDRWGFIWSGTFRPFHGLIEIVASMASRPTTTFSLYGDGPMRSSIEDIAAASPADIRCHGPVDRESLWQAHTEHRAMIIGRPPGDQKFHYSPVKLREATAAGCLVIAPAVGELRTFASEPWFLPYRDLDGLHARIDEVESLDVRALSELHRAATHFAASHFSWSEWTAFVRSAIQAGQPQ